jgi:hypothetical protein
MPSTQELVSPKQLAGNKARALALRRPVQRPDHRLSQTNPFPAPTQRETDHLPYSETNPSRAGSHSLRPIEKSAQRAAARPSTPPHNPNIPNPLPSSQLRSPIFHCPAAAPARATMEHSLPHHNMKFGVIVVPGNNCGHDAAYAVGHNLGQTLVHAAEFIWHSSAIARFSPVMGAVKRFAPRESPRQVRTSSLEIGLILTHMLPLGPIPKIISPQLAEESSLLSLVQL